MSTHELRLIGDLDLSILEFPQRSRLFMLPPIGLDTVNVEGLLSYLVRLGRAHSVNPRRLIRTEFAAANPGIGRLCYTGFFVGYAGGIDGLGKYAETFADAVEKLNGIDTCHMTLLPLRSLLPANGAGLLAEYPKWCPVCIDEMLRLGREVFRPLAWSFDLNKACAIHNRLLESCCDHCGRTQPFIPNYPDLGRCAHCQRLLVAGGGNENGIPTVLEIWVASAIADLVEHLPALEAVATLEQLVAFLKTAVELHADGNRAAFCRQIGLPHWALTGWISHQEKPSLPQLLSVCYGLGIMPSDIFLPGNDAGAFPANNVPRKLPSKLFGRSERPLLGMRDRQLIQSELEKIAADSSDACPLADVAKLFKLRRSCLKYWFPDQCEAIMAKHVVARKREAEERNKLECEEVVRIVGQIFERGEYPGRKRVEAELRKRGASLIRPDLFEVYLRALAGK